MYSVIPASYVLWPSV